MRILIVEEALRLGNGHWPRYVADLAAGFRAEGDVVDVLGHRDANDKVKSVVPNVVPWLSRDCRADSRRQGLIGGIRHNLCLKRELGAWLKGREPYDWILSLSSRPKHLLAFAMLARAGYCARSRFLLLFVISPGQQDEAGKFRLSASNLFAKFCFALLRPAVCRCQVVIAAETKGMQAEIERFSDLRTVLFPHPVEAAQAREENAGKLEAEMLKKDGTTKDTTPARQRIAQGEVECVGWEPTGAKRSEGHKKREEVSTTIERQGGREDPGGWVTARETAEGSLQGETPWEGANQQQPKVGPQGEGVGTTESNGTDGHGRSALDSPAKPVLVVAPGLARYEKGSDIFMKAIRLVLQKAEELKLEKLKSLDAGRWTLDSYASCSPLPALRFVLQWPEDFDLPDGRRCGPDPDLLKDERVKFSKDLLTGEAYWDFLQQADVIVLPYRSESYRARVSRVAIEAAMLGKPMVYTKGTWISEVVAMGGSGVAIAEETPQSLAEAIQMAIGDLDTLQSEAEGGVARVRKFYSVSSFHHLLGEVGGNKK